MQVGEPDDAEADVAWRALQARMRDARRARTRRRVWLAIPTFTLAAAGALIVAASLRVGSNHPVEQAIEVGRPFESADAEVALALPEGIQVDLDRRSRVRLESVAPEEIRVALSKGSARFDVEPHRPRRVVINADDVEVRVIGTRFRVTRIEAATAEDEARVEVAVERGVVEVRDRQHAGEPRRLRAGERFSMPAISTGGEVAGSRPDGDEDGDAAVAPMNEPALTPVVRLASTTRISSPTEISGSLATARRAGAASPRALLERAQMAWRAGRMNEAAADYAEVLDRHPADPRAALAAFELGRIQMDHLADLTAATASFERALHLAPRASFQEDTLARLAQANDRLGRQADCRRVRQRYMREYPNGLHVARVSDLCP
jgi:transmembrane sensor